MKPADRLAAELHRLDMFPPPDQRPYLKALVQIRGEAVTMALRREVGETAWLQGLSLLKVPSAANAVRRACGFGALLTEFLIAPLALDPLEQTDAASLGARVNLIVSLYDHYVDQGMAPHQVLPEQGGEAAVPLVPLLVRGYYARLRPSRNTALVHRAIARMRDAEDRVAAGESSPLLWRRKSALPWVVMGMSPRGADDRFLSSAQSPMPRVSTAARASKRVSSGSQEPHLSHLAWLYRLGCFLGWIDDAADVERDRSQGRANAFAKLHPQEVPGIARSGRNLLKWWDARCRDADTRSAFLYCVNSWIDSRPK